MEGGREGKRNEGGEKVGEETKEEKRQTENGK